MVDKKISGLTAGSAVAATDLLPAVETVGVGPVYKTAAQIKTFTSASPTLVTPTLGVAAGTSLALGGATIGSYALAVTGSWFNDGSSNINFGATTLAIAPSVGGQQLNFTVNGTAGHASLRYDHGLTLHGSMNLGWGSGTATATMDTWIGRAAAATIRLGQTDVDLNASIVAQKLRPQGALAGGTADQAGKDFTIQGSPGKGTGIGGSIIFQTTPAGASSTTVGTQTTALTISSTQSVLASSPTGGMGYGTGAGGAVTQATSRTTGVTLNKITGAITLFTAAGSATPASFTVTNSTVAATDVVNVSVKSATTNKYAVIITAVAAGSFEITFWAVSGTTSDAPVFNFAVQKAVAA